MYNTRGSDILLLCVKLCLFVQGAISISESGKASYLIFSKQNKGKGTKAWRRSSPNSSLKCCLKLHFGDKFRYHLRVIL